MSETDVKNSIVESATKFFSKYGFHKTTMDEIAKHIHKAKGVLYYYFKNKEELFNEVLKQELSSVKAELNRISNSNKDYLTIIKNYFLTRLKLLSTAVNYHETLKADFFEKYHFVKDVRDDFTEFEYAQLYRIFKNGNSEGYLDIKNVKSTVNMVMMLLNSIELPLYLQNKYDEYERTIEELVTMIINSFRSYKK
ncbi:MAG: TetR/AcrR family transcriptional regulator [Bacteroidales bacterium]|nr:TetR/AcrR family transcriptional regulator [Bacteroidales bacterium]